MSVYTRRTTLRLSGLALSVLVGFTVTPVTAATIHLIGLPGTPGAPGAPAGPGGTGGPGANSVNVLNPAVDNGNTLSATGGAGGVGGKGGDGDASNPPGGIGGNAGAGGSAEARIVTSVPNGGFDNTLARGGAGGEGGRPGNDSVTGQEVVAGGAGGAGGAATSSVNISAPAAFGNAQATAEGGAGGLSRHTGVGAAGGSATASLTTDMQAGNAVTDAYATGGRGGNSFLGTGGAGGNAQTTGNLTFRGVAGGPTTVSAVLLHAIGGEGGDTTDGSAGGNGGNASSQLVLNTFAVPGQLLQAAPLVIAVGGNGGDAAGGGTGGNGGTATGQISGALTGNAFGDARLSLQGGNGGSGFHGGQGADVTANNAFLQYNYVGAAIVQTVRAGGGGGGNGGIAAGGGDATARWVSTLNRSYVENEAVGGNGGFGGNTSAGGAGGEALAITRNQSLGRTWAIASATGGNGGDSDFGHGGDGGLARLSTTPNDGTRALSSAGPVISRGTAIGGNGGSVLNQHPGQLASHGGNGASVLLNNIVSGLTLGDLTVAQSATSGAGGSAWDGAAGLAGTAESHLSFNAVNSSADVEAQALGGAGGGKFASTGTASHGGAASASVVVTGDTPDFDVTANAIGGQGGTGRFGAAAGNGGTSTAVADVTSTSLLDGEVRAQALASSPVDSWGGTGIDGSVAGRGGDSQATSIARSTGQSATASHAIAYGGHGGLARTESGTVIPTHYGDGGTATALAIATNVAGDYGFTGAVAEARGGHVGDGTGMNVLAAGRGGDATAIAQVGGGASNLALANAYGGVAMRLDRLGNSLARAEGNRTEASAQSTSSSFWGLGLQTTATASHTVGGTISEAQVKVASGLPVGTLTDEQDAAVIGTTYPDLVEFAAALDGNVNAAAALAAVDPTTAGLVMMGARGGDAGVERTGSFSFGYESVSAEDMVLALLLPEFTGAGFDSLKLTINTFGDFDFTYSETFEFDDVESATDFFDDHVFRFAVDMFRDQHRVGISFSYFGSADDSFAFQAAFGQAAVPLPGTVWLLLSGLALLGGQRWRRR